MRTKHGGKEFCMFALPGLFCFLAVVIVPFIYGVYLTLTDWDGVSSVRFIFGSAGGAGGGSRFLGFRSDAFFGAGGL